MDGHCPRIFCAYAIHIPKAMCLDLCRCRDLRRRTTGENAKSRPCIEVFIPIGFFTTIGIIELDFQRIRSDRSFGSRSTVIDTVESESIRQYSRLGSR